MDDNKSVGSYENDYNHESMPLVGEAKPAHEGSQSSSPFKFNPFTAEGRKNIASDWKARYGEREGPPAPPQPARGMFGWGGLTN